MHSKHNKDMECRRQENDNNNNNNNENAPPK